MFVNLYIEYYLLFSFHTFTFLTLTDASQKKIFDQNLLTYKRLNVANIFKVHPI